MQFLDYSHNPALIGASLLVALMAGFTGLSLTQGLAQRSTLQKKLSIALAAISLGGGIWSMHFVAMLGLQLPILFYYDAAVTLSSALVAILVVGVALLLLHFRERTPLVLVSAGSIVGLGIIAMHYIGMAGLEMCRALYTPLGITLAVLASCLLNIAAFWIAYGQRSHRNILLGTVCFGVAVVAVHFIAIAGTGFVADSSVNEVGPSIGKEIMAMGVVLSSFVLCGAFLLTGVTFLEPSQQVVPAVVAETSGEGAIAEVASGPIEIEPRGKQIPYELKGQTLFADLDSVAAIRAEGHYTHIYTAHGVFFCAWSITEAEKRVAPNPFLKTHRSYLINPAHVISFERLKDNGICHFDLPGLAKVPVSRSRLKQVRATLGV